MRELEINGLPATPFEMFIGEKPCLSKFKVLFCPVVVKIGDKKDDEKRVRTQKNTAEPVSKVSMLVSAQGVKDDWSTYHHSIM